MLRIEVKESEGIDRAIKRYQKKYKRTKMIQQLRENQFYTKKSEELREQKKKAIYKQQFLNEQES